VGLCLLLAFLCLPGRNLQAQELDLPVEEHLAAALSDQYSRTDTLMTMIAVARLLDYGVSADLDEIDALTTRFRDERAWLDRLAETESQVGARARLAAAFLRLVAPGDAEEIDGIDVPQADGAQPFVHGGRQAYVIAPEACRACRLCVDACPEDALTLAARVR